MRILKHLLHVKGLNCDHLHQIFPIHLLKVFAHIVRPNVDQIGDGVRLRPRVVVVLRAQCVTILIVVTGARRSRIKHLETVDEVVLRVIEAA